MAQEKYFLYILKMRTSENRTTEILRCQGPSAYYFFEYFVPLSSKLDNLDCHKQQMPGKIRVKNAMIVGN